MFRARIIKVIHPLLWLFDSLLRTTLGNIIIQMAERYILGTSPKKYQDVLIPSYRKVFYEIEMYRHWRANYSRYIAIGCRRILYDFGYLAALHRPNITLRSNDIEAIVEDGIVTKAGNNSFGCHEEYLSDISCR